MKIFPTLTNLLKLVGQSCTEMIGIKIQKSENNLIEVVIDFDSKRTIHKNLQQK